MKNKILLATIFCILASSVLFVSWDENDRELDLLTNKLIASPTFKQLHYFRMSMTKEFELANATTRKEFAKHHHIEFQRIYENKSLTEKEKREALSKIGLTMTDKFEELRKKGDDMLQQLKKEIAELFKLSKADFRQVYTTAFRSLTKQNKQYEN